MGHQTRLLAESAMLSRKLTGHYNYFAISGNNRSVGALYPRALIIWRKWLRRRSQRPRMTWERYDAFLRMHPLLAPQSPCPDLVRGPAGAKGNRSGLLEAETNQE
jgi:hypothetical protein